jgi:hypothetical protein
MDYRLIQGKKWNQCQCRDRELEFRLQKPYVAALTFCYVRSTASVQNRFKYRL